MSAIASAADAINLASNTMGEKPPQPMPAVKGRHWSFYVLAAGSAVGIVCGMAAVALKIYAVAVIGAILFVSSGIGAYYIQKFNVFTQLDDYIPILTDKIKKLSSSVLDLRKTNDGLKKTVQDLNGEIKKSDDMWKKGAANFEIKVKELDETTKKLQDAQAKLQKMEGLYLNIQKAIAAFSSNVSELAKSNAVLDANIAKLATEVKTAFDAATKLDAENKQFDANNEAYDKLNKMNLDFLQAFEKEVANILKLKGEADKVARPMEASSNALSSVSAQIDASLQKIEQMEKKESSLWQNSGQLDSAIDSVAKALEAAAKQNGSK